MAGSYRAAVLEAFGQPLRLKTVPIPQAQPGSTVIKVLATPVSPNCRAVYSGKIGLAPLQIPVIPSASCIGRVHDVGPDATSLKHGQLVFASFYIRSRDNPDSNILAGYMGGNQQLESAWSYGAFAEYACVPLECTLALNEAVLCEELQYKPAELTRLANLCISFAGLMDIGVSAGDVVVVAPATGYYGGGAVHAAVALGARVIACGRNEETLKKMKDAFAASGRFKTVTMTGNVETDTTAIRSAAGGKGADKYVDFISPQAAQSTHLVSCLSALRPHGSAVLMGAVPGAMEMPYTLIMKNNLRIQGRYMFERHHAEQALKVLESGQLTLGSKENSGIETHAYKLKDVENAVDAAAELKGWGNAVVLEL